MKYLEVNGVSYYPVLAETKLHVFRNNICFTYESGVPTVLYRDFGPPVDSEAFDLPSDAESTLELVAAENQGDLISAMLNICVDRSFPPDDSEKKLQWTSSMDMMIRSLSKEQYHCAPDGFFYAGENQDSPVCLTDIIASHCTKSEHELTQISDSLSADSSGGNIESTMTDSGQNTPIIAEEETIMDANPDILSMEELLRLAEEAPGADAPAPEIPSLDIPPIVPDIPIPEAISSEAPPVESAVMEESAAQSIVDAMLGITTPAPVSEAPTEEPAPVPEVIAEEPAPISEAPAEKSTPVPEESAPTPPEPTTDPLLEQLMAEAAQTAAEAAPTIEEAPIAEAAPITEEPVSIPEETVSISEEPVSIPEEALNIEDIAPATEEMTAAEETPAIEEAPTVEEAPVAEAAPADEEAISIPEEPISIPEEALNIEDIAPATEEITAAEETPAAEDIHAVEEAPVAEAAPITEEPVSIPEEALTAEAAPAAEAISSGAPGLRRMESAPNARTFCVRVDGEALGLSAFGPQNLMISDNSFIFPDGNTLVTQNILTGEKISAPIGEGAVAAFAFSIQHFAAENESYTGRSIVFEWFCSHLLKLKENPATAERINGYFEFIGCPLHCTGDSFTDASGAVVTVAEVFEKLSEIKA